MAKVPLEMPHLGMVAENIQVVSWLKTEGDSFARGEFLLEVETEKSVVQVEAPMEGKLLRILVGEGETVGVGTTLAEVEAEGAGAPPAPREPKPDAGSAAQVAPDQKHPVAPPKERQAATNRRRSSPAARRLARELGVSVETVQGTGPRGRVQLRDVELAAERRFAAPPALQREAPAAAQGVSYRDLSPMRAATARAMSASATIPQFCVERRVDWTQVNALLRDGGAAAAGPGISINDVLMKAAAQALLRFPQMNAVFAQEGDGRPRLAVPEGVHIGLVVAVEDGLLVPVLHRVERLSLAEIAGRRKELVERARAGKLRGQDLAGATFSISNLGAGGPDRFVAMLNPPHSSILAVGRAIDTPVVFLGEIVARPVSQLTLTIDHRVVDGKMASEFLGFLTKSLEVPGSELQERG